ncbi:MAG: phosphatidylglycerol lysyltransferase domain-containing protein [Oscillospiraceae bacterium]|nr:phosphatidylglycerol lysyltransferase domain-containing protein [Oscillospiraceae bacterium]
MLEFKEVKLSDKQWARELLSYSGYRGCEYTFGNNYIWQCVYGTKIARYKDFYLLKSGGGYFFPAGRGDFCDAVNILQKDAEENNQPFTFVTMNQASKLWLEENFPDKFTFSTDRGFYDYVYHFCDLAELKGKQYHSKRNFINRFNMYNNKCYEPITPRNIEECARMSECWLKENSTHNQNNDTNSLESEGCVVKKGLESFFELDFSGGLLRVDGEVAAFTFGEEVTKDTFVVHAEKAFTRIQGAYPAINNCFVKNACCGYTYINREEDMGLENLRKAKMSYHPAFLEEKFKAKLL